VERISVGCFYECESVCEIIFETGSKLQRIEEHAFSSSGLKTIRIPSSVEFIGEHCFYECKSLCEIGFEGNVKLIEGNAFDSCRALKCVKIPRGVNLNCQFPKQCQIEYIDIPNIVAAEPKVSTPTAKVSKPARVKPISDFVIELDDKYETFTKCGKVKLMRHQETGEEIAVKSFDVEFQKEFLSEVEALKKLNHPHIVRLKGCCLPTGNKGFKIVMEYVGGGTLQELLKSDLRKPRWWTSTRKSIVIAEIVKGMKFIHSNKIIHRDLKPTNILVDNEHNIKISDFGTSRLFETDVTMTNAGTLLYTAPEVSKGHYDKKIDVYSFEI
jgi:serine/threonine protein kinase